MRISDWSSDVCSSDLMHRWLMRAFAASGQRTSALAAYDACRSLLREELDVAPEPETEALYKAILLRAEPGWSAASAGQPLQLPAVSVAEAPAVPISNLSSAAVELLQIAAVCENHFSRRLLDAIGEQIGSAQL